MVLSDILTVDPSSDVQRAVGYWRHAASGSLLAFRRILSDAASGSFNSDVQGTRVKAISLSP